jgi:signal transduction histidine kinase
MFSSKRILSILILSFAVFAAIALAFLTLVGSQDHERDHVALDIVPRQRELVQQITFVALSDPADPLLTEKAEKFEENMVTLWANFLNNDDLFSRIRTSANGTEQVRQELGVIRSSWQSYRDTLDTMKTLPVSESTRSLPVEEFQVESESLLAQLDGTSAAINDHMESDLVLVRRWQVLLVIAATGMGVWGILLLRSKRPEVALTAPYASSNQPGEQAGFALDPADGTASDLTWQPHPDAFDQEASGAPATQAGIRRLRELMATYQYSQDILQELDFTHLLQLATSKAQTMMQADSAAICLVEPEGTTLELMSVQGDAAVVLNFSDSVKPGQPLQIIATTEAAVKDQVCKECVFFTANQSGTCLSAPLQIGNESIGALCVSRQNERPFDDLEHRALELMASSVALGISNSRMAETSRHEARQAGILAERQRVAAELHDNLAQSLNYVNLKIERAQSLLDSDHGNSALQEINAISQATSNAYQQVRVALSDLQEPPVFEDNFSQELSDYVTSLQEAYELEIDMVLNERAVAKMDALTQKQALFIAREALSNVARHARAEQVWLRLGQNKGQTILVIEDNGRGFRVQDRQKRSHLGLMIMRARAERIGGELIIDSQPNQGTKVTAYFPQVHEELAATDSK